MLTGKKRLLYLGGTDLRKALVFAVAAFASVALLAAGSPKLELS
jgi:hypothetical protein